MTSLQTQYKFIHFKKKVEDKRKTSVWDCAANDNECLLGQVKWYSPWRQYCFLPEAFTVFHAGCLRDVAHFIQQLTEERKKVLAPGHGFNSERSQRAENGGRP